MGKLRCTRAVPVMGPDAQPSELKVPSHGWGGGTRSCAGGMRGAAERPAALQLPDGGAGRVRRTTPKILVPKSPYTIHGVKALGVATADQTVLALLDPGVEIPREIDVRMPGTLLAVRVTVARGGCTRRPEVSAHAVALVRRWNRRRSLARGRRVHAAG